jgi:hypothetical protein
MKRFFKSKTLWFNIVSGAVVVADKLSGNVIPEDIATTVIIVGNTVLRLITKKAITK